MSGLAIAILLATIGTAYGADIQSSTLKNGKHLVTVDGDLTKEDVAGPDGERLPDPRARDEEPNDPGVLLQGR
jgi:hypothetical protein